MPGYRSRRALQHLRVGVDRDDIMPGRPQDAGQLARAGPDIRHLPRRRRAGTSHRLGRILGAGAVVLPAAAPNEVAWSTTPLTRR